MNESADAYEICMVKQDKKANLNFIYLFLQLIQLTVQDESKLKQFVDS